jgi:hypothetical protein
MFDHTACAGQATLSTSPFVDMAALSALGNPLADVLKAQPASSNVALSGASWASRDPNRAGHLHRRAGPCTIGRGEAHVREDSLEHADKCQAAPLTGANHDL